VKVRLTVRNKLLAGFGVIALSLLVVGATSLYEMARIDSGVTHLSTRTIPKDVLVGEFTTAVNKYRKDQLHYILALPKDRVGANGVSGDLAGDVTTLNQIFAAQSAAASNAADRALFAKVRRDFGAYVRLTSAFRPLADRGLTQAAGNAVGTGPGDAAYDQVKTDMVTLQTRATDEGNLFASRAQSTYSQTRWLVAGLIAAALLAAGVLAFLISRGAARSATALHAAAERLERGDVSQPVGVYSGDELGDVAAAYDRTFARLDDLARSAERIAAGDLTTTIEVASADDALGQAFAHMAEGLRGAIARVGEVAAVIKSASNKLAETSGETGRAVSEIARAVEDVAHGSEQQVRLTVDAREAAGRSSEIAHRTRELATGGVKAAEDATAAMIAVDDASGRIAATIEGLAARSERIGGIVDTIQSIAEQTNLLALNAAIEAARAGEQGRGFAVVAEEVRKLAEESRTAAGTIAGLIGEIQTETHTAVDVVAEGGARTKRGAEIVQQARAAFDQIDEAIAAIAAEIPRVVDAADHLTTVAEGSSAALEEVSASTQETSAASQEVSTSAGILAGTADELDALVGRFRL
jgi:methyl-accepting chemotaxis protein